MVKLFMHNVFKYHGMPQSIVSDRDQRMTSLFWKALFENMGTMLKFSSLFHPQTNGQSREANSTVLDLFKCYVSECKATWEHYLPLVEYAYNNTVHTSTRKAPFEIVEGGKKVPPILHTKDKIFEADKYVQNTDEAYKKIKLALEKTQSKQKKAADRYRRELVFSLGDWVLLRFEKARLRKMKGKERLFPKLGMRYYGPFQISQAEIHVHVQLPYMPDMPDLPGTSHPDEEHQGPVPGALDVRGDLEQNIDDMPEGPAKEFLIHKKKVMESAALAFLQPKEQVKSFGHKFLPLPLICHEAIL
ncbi:hypothetical protein L7F22_031808 [Adiantum nelumboides]|nr:hypothetical protein [Adiantum nelumboides]